MLVKSGYNRDRNATTVWVSTNCYTDSLPLVSEIVFSGVEFDIKTNAFHLGTAVLLSEHAGEVVEYLDRKVGGDFAEAIRSVLRSHGNVAPLDTHDRALAAGEIDVACFPARYRNVSWPVTNDLTPLQLVDWSGDFVTPGTHSTQSQAVGRIFTNAGLVADETLVSICIGLMHAGNRVGRLLVPLAEGVPASRYAHVVRALAIAGVTLKLVPVRATDALGAAPTTDQVVVMLTHRTDDRVLRHFERLKREAGPLLPVYLALQDNSAEPPAGVDIHVPDSLAPAAIPARAAEMRARKMRHVQGYLDLVLLTIADSPVLPNYRHIWIAEYDVDFAGDWRDFFARYLRCDADVVANNILTRAECADWPHWKYSGKPEDVPPEQQLRMYTQIVRLSRQMISTYRQEMARPGWRGYYEHTMPTAALHHGLSIEDIAGEGRFAAPPERRMHRPSTWKFRPVLGNHYFHEKPAAFTPGLLHHPVKPLLDAAPAPQLQAEVTEPA